MDEEPPVFLAYQPYKGPASIPHAPADFFGAFFLATNVSGGGRRGARARESERKEEGIARTHHPARRSLSTPTRNQQSAMLWHMFPGKFMGTEVRARRHE
jgi:hypothetical protein